MPVIPGSPLWLSQPCLVLVPRLLLCWCIRCRPDGSQSGLWGHLMLGDAVFSFTDADDAKVHAAGEMLLLASCTSFISCLIHLAIFGMLLPLHFAAEEVSTLLFMHRVSSVVASEPLVLSLCFLRRFLLRSLSESCRLSRHCHCLALLCQSIGGGHPQPVASQHTVAADSALHKTCMSADPTSRSPRGRLFCLFWHSCRKTSSKVWAQHRRHVGNFKQLPVKTASLWPCACIKS